MLENNIIKAQIYVLIFVKKKKRKNFSIKISITQNEKPNNEIHYSAFDFD